MFFSKFVSTLRRIAVISLIRFHCAIRRLFYRFFKPIGIGVRTIIINNRNEVLLIEHTYKPNLYFPGGGVEKFEELAVTAVREVNEEVGIQIISPKLIGIYRDINHIVNDILFIYLVKLDNKPQIQIECMEIKSANWYPLLEVPFDRMNTRCLIALKDYLSKKPPVNIEV